MTEQAPARDAAEERSAVEQIVSTKAYVDKPELLSWYTSELEEPKPDVRDLFESYSKVPRADVVAHIKHIRDEAFKIVSLPCHVNEPGSCFCLASLPMSGQLGLPQLFHRNRARVPPSRQPHQEWRAIPRSGLLHGPRHSQACPRRRSVGEYVCF